MTHNFCESCNRVRLTCTGTLYMCLGQEDAADLRTPLRQSEGDELLDAAILEAIGRKPKGHDFIIDRRRKQPAVSRHISVTGGCRPVPAIPRLSSRHSLPGPIGISAWRRLSAIASPPVPNAPPLAGHDRTITRPNSSH